jgi:2-polyprenyl-6-hydroxyphenyl methylase/3-demethylubiquinone-9 3-methyltransferase
MKKLEKRRLMHLFERLPLMERLFVRARWASAPLEAFCSRVPSGLIAEVGCGHGLLTALLAVDRPDRRLVGVDPDPRKIAWASLGPGTLANVLLRQGNIECLSPEFDGRLDAIVIADVLYLLPVSEWVKFLARCRLLLRPGGWLLLKETEARSSWKYLKCVAQEWVMVKLLQRTRDSGGLNLKPRAYVEELLRQTGFELREVVDLSRGYTTPHILFSAQAA